MIMISFTLIKIMSHTTHVNSIEELYRKVTAQNQASGEIWKDIWITSLKIDTEG